MSAPSGPTPGKINCILCFKQCSCHWGFFVFVFVCGFVFGLLFFFIYITECSGLKATEVQWHKQLVTPYANSHFKLIISQRNNNPLFTIPGALFTAIQHMHPRKHMYPRKPESLKTLQGYWDAASVMLQCVLFGMSFPQWSPNVLFYHDMSACLLCLLCFIQIHITVSCCLHDK